MFVHQIKFYKNKYILCNHTLLTSTKLICARHVKIRKLQCNICMNIIKKAFTLIYIIAFYSRFCLSFKMRAF